MEHSIGVGDRVKHYKYGKGVVTSLVSQGLAEVKFDKTSEYVELKNLASLEQIKIQRQAKKKKARWGDLRRVEEKKANARQLDKERILGLLITGNYSTAEKLYRNQCAEWWDRSDFNEHKKHARQEHERKAAKKEERRLAAERGLLKDQVTELLDAANYKDADILYQSRCSEWWDLSDFEDEKSRGKYINNFVKTYATSSLGELDALYRTRPDNINMPVKDFISLKLTRIRRELSAVGMQLDEEQECAISRPELRLLIKARAGSGKTRTLCARAALTIRDEGLTPNQVMILAFNKAAAADVKHRVQKQGGIADYGNARTFHSLAYQLVKPQKKLLFDVGGNPSAREQSRFVQRLMQRIINPAFKEAMVEFFRKELEQIEDMGRDLEPKEYFTFRKALEQVTLRGERVKSNGEKFIADFLFEHGIEYQYERAWEWKSDILGGAAYRPDFTIVHNGKDYILEHWAIDPADQNALLPKHWDITAEKYSRQITDKIEYWKLKGIPLLETHTGLMAHGREDFEKKLSGILEGSDIQCQLLPKEEIIQRVFENDFAISRIAGLFLQFIQRVKKRVWSPDEVSRRILESPDREPRARLFHQLALRAYREYQAILEEDDAMDFDDLLIQAMEEVQSRGASASIHLGEGVMMPIGELKWVMLDEYQDFSELFFRMLESILNVVPGIRLVAVGDDWQAINAFTGADLCFFTRFADYFPDAESVGITSNYRSGKAIVNAGNRLMKGRGSSAKSSRSNLGHIELKYLGDAWIEFREGDQYKQNRDADSLFLPPRNDGKSHSEIALRQARALKLCSEIIQKNPSQKTLLLSRTGLTYGLELKDFRARLIKVMSTLRNEDSKYFEGIFHAMTAHSSKGQEADRVIILDATQRQFPKIHPDNMLFELFGVTPHTVLEEERRLFYVAITRARHRLYVLTEKEFESPYLDGMSNPSQLDINIPPSNPTVLGDLATEVLARIEDIPDITPILGAGNLNPWSLVYANVSSSIRELVTALEASDIPVPETEYYLPEGDDEQFAELAWPNSSPPVAILVGKQVGYSNSWTSIGWKVPGPDLTIEKIVIGVRHHV